MLWQPETLLEVRGLMSFPDVLASRYTSCVAAAPGNSSNLLASVCRLGAAESDVDLSADELEERMEAFMRKQAEQESGEPAVRPECMREDMGTPFALRNTCTLPSALLARCILSRDSVPSRDISPFAGGVVAAEPQPSKVLGADEVTEEVSKSFLLCHIISICVGALDAQHSACCTFLAQACSVCRHDTVSHAARSQDANARQSAGCQLGLQQCIRQCMVVCAWHSAQCCLLCAAMAASPCCLPSMW